jgi:hypothetical protein
MFTLQPQIGEARRKKEAILRNPEYSRSKRTQFTNMLQLESNVNSAIMEIASGSTEMGVTKSSTGDVDSPHVLKRNVEDIWKWLLEETEDKISIDQPNIIALAKKFSPMNTNFNYRQDRVHMKGLQYAPPNPLKVPELMDSVEHHISCQDINPLERALIAHFHITRIQPFNDGNKRTARMVQNLILHKNDYVPILIKEGERNFYIDLLESAMIAFKDRTSSLAPGSESCFTPELSQQERQFFSYLVAKEVSALDDVKDHLAKNREYLVTMGGQEPGVLYAGKKLIKGFFRKRDLNGKVKLNQQERYLKIFGDISRDQVETILDSKPGQYELRTINN